MAEVGEWHYVPNADCPLPAIRARERVKGLRPDDRRRLDAVFTDLGALRDAPAWCALDGHRVASGSDLEVHELVIAMIVGDGWCSSHHIRSRNTIHTPSGRMSSFKGP